MTPHFVLDADFVIYAIGGDEAAQRWLLDHTQDLAISAIAYGQVEAGLTEEPLFVRQRTALDALLVAAPVAPYDAVAAREFARLVHRSGSSRKHALDRMIAAQALALNAALVTNNVRDFAGIDGLRLENWRGG